MRWNGRNRVSARMEMAEMKNRNRNEKFREEKNFWIDALMMVSPPFIVLRGGGIRSAAATEWHVAALDWRSSSSVATDHR